MRQKSGPEKVPAEQVVKDIRRATRRQFSAEENIRIVLEGVRGEESIAALCRREGDCQDFRVWAAIMNPKEVPDGTTQSSPHS